jgi:hypothetical protein
VLIKEREPRNQQLRTRLGAGAPLTPAAMTSRTVSMPESATGVPVRADAAGRAEAGTSTAAPTLTYTGAIPPRPRKKGKKR